MFTHIKDQVAQGNLFEALTALRELAEDSQHSNKWIGLMARYSDLKEQVDADTLSYEEVSRNKNKLTQSLLAFIDDVEKSSPVSPSKLGRFLKQPQGRFSLAGLLVIIIVAGVFLVMSRPNQTIKNSGTTITTGEGDVDIKTEGSNSPLVFGKEADIRYGGDFSAMEEETDSLKTADSLTTEKE